MPGSCRLSDTFSADVPVQICQPGTPVADGPGHIHAHRPGTDIAFRFDVGTQTGLQARMIRVPVAPDRRLQNIHPVA